jgi:hypothetical protein
MKFIFSLLWLTNLDSPLLDFYLQLYAIDIGINTKLAFYSVGTFGTWHIITAIYLIIVVR